MKIIAFYSIGMENVLKNEIKDLGYKILNISDGMITYEGEMKDVYISNLCLRTAERVMIEMGEFKAENFDELFDNIYAIDWQDYIDHETTVVIDKLRSRMSKLFALSTIQSVAQKAIFKKLMNMYDLKNMNKTNKKVNIRIYIKKDTVKVALDTSGEPLHKRGYRKLISEAPMKETIAAGLILASKWDKKSNLYDPFCGSGTIPIEAYLIAKSIPPGIRRNFDFEKLDKFNKREFEKIKIELMSKIEKKYINYIFGSDTDEKMIETSMKNAEYWGAADLNFVKNDFKKVDYSKKSYKNFVITNPPFGIRIGDEKNAINIYRELQKIRYASKNTEIYLFSSSSDLKTKGFKDIKTVLEIQNGKVKSYLYKL